MNIEDVMRNLVNLDGGPDVFSVSLMYTDHSTLWTAHATLRADDRNISAEASTPERALAELTRLVLSIICPVCHRIMEDEIR